MKHFLTRIILSVVAIAVIAVGFDYYITKRLQDNRTDLRFTTWNEIIYSNIDADVLIMGSSRAYVQYSPYVIDSVLGTNSYNIGFYARSFNGQYQRYNVYRHYQKKPALIIQNIDFNSTLGFYWGEPDHVDYLREQYFPHIHNKEFMSYITDPINPLERYVPFYRYYGYNITGMLQSMKERDQYKGFCSHYWKFDQFILPKDSFEFECDETMKQQFIEYVAQTKEEGINLVLVYAPLYIRAINYVRDLDRCYATFDSIAKAYDVPILDYTFSTLSYDSTNFYNANHLNTYGAADFSAMLANDIDSLGLLPK